MKDAVVLLDFVMYFLDVFEMIGIGLKNLSLQEEEFVEKKEICNVLMDMKN